MDEQGLAELFREAVSDPPPASFGPAEVIAASHRATARRRGVLTGGTLLGVAMLTGGLLTSGVVGGSQPHHEAGQGPPQTAPDVAGPGTAHPLGTPPRAETPTPRTGAAEGEQARCGPFDDALATGVTTVLAERGDAVAGPAGEVPWPCPIGSRSAAVPVVGGTLYVLVIPRATQPERSDVVSPDGRHEHVLMLGGGRALVLVSMPATPGQQAPLGDDVPTLAEELAKRL
ncbi:MAG: hypothetical protein ACRDTE_33740 [Pseudonocardiaceae bacterium]